MSKERPILFNGDMVRALLDGRKTQTRRIVPKWQMPEETEGPHDRFPDSRWMSVAQRDSRYGFGVFGATEDECMNNYNTEYGSLCPYGQPGDRLWVRETWGVVSHSFDSNGGRSEYQPDRPATPIQEMPFGQGYYHGHVIYAADGGFEWTGDDDGGGDTRSAWKPSIHMPRIASRITLEIVSVRVERLQDISNEDAVSEGVGTPLDMRYAALEEFKPLWESINGTGAWAENPWVWVVEFKRVEASQ